MILVRKMEVVSENDEMGPLVPEYLPDPAGPHCQHSEQLLPRATVTGSPGALEPSGKAVVVERTCLCVQGQHIVSAETI